MSLDSDDNLQTATNKVQMNTVDAEEGVVLATVTKAQFGSQDRLRIRAELSNGTTMKEFFTLPEVWSDESRYVKFAEMEDVPWTANTMTENSIEGQKVPVHEERGDWQVYLPEPDKTRREKLRDIVDDTTYADVIVTILLFLAVAVVIAILAYGLVSVVGIVLGALL